MRYCLSLFVYLICRYIVISYRCHVSKTHGKIGTPFLGTRAVPRSDASRPGSWSSVAIFMMQVVSYKNKS